MRQRSVLRGQNEAGHGADGRAGFREPRAHRPPGAGNMAIAKAQAAREVDHHGLLLWREPGGILDGERAPALKSQGSRGPRSALDGPAGEAAVTLRLEHEY